MGGYGEKMNHKKSQVALLIVMLIIIILVVGAVLLIYFNKDKWFKKQEKKNEEETEKVISVFARVYDSALNKYVKANFTFEADGQILKSGELEPTFNQFDNLPINKTFTLCFWNGDNYRSCDIYDRSYSFRNLTLDDGIFENTARKGKINITSLNPLEKDRAYKLIFNISSKDGTLKRLSVCTFHTTGIIYVALPDSKVECNMGWNNYTFDVNGNKINLTNNFYYCESQQRFEYCSKKIDNDCIIPNLNVPSRLKDAADQCFYTGQYLQNNNYILELETKTMKYIDGRDYIRLFIVDGELTRKDDGTYDILTEGNNNEDNGIKDIEFKLWFEDDILPKFN